MAEHWWARTYAIWQAPYESWERGTGPQQREHMRGAWTQFVRVRLRLAVSCTSSARLIQGATGRVSGASGADSLRLRSDKLRASMGLATVSGRRQKDSSAQISSTWSNTWLIWFNSVYQSLIKYGLSSEMQDFIGSKWRTFLRFFHRFFESKAHRKLSWRAWNGEQSPSLGIVRRFFYPKLWHSQVWCFVNLRFE